MDRREAIQAMGLGTLAAAGLATSASAQPPTAVGGYANGAFVLPPLPYEANALEPHIDAQTMALHHDKHHAAYVKGANAALDALRQIRDGQRDPADAKRWEKDLAFHGSGHVLHTLFWANMSPEPSPPSGGLQAAIQRDFGAVEALMTQFSGAANTVEGGGWAILAYHPMIAGLVVLQAESHQNLTLQGAVPLLVIDVWEHAYYLRYQNRRADYVTAWWNVADWGAASTRYAAATAGA
jgi:superoxide dismutase, Fe-Mn family